MKKFGEIAEGKDKMVSYDGKSVSIIDLLGEKVEIHAFRKINIHGKPKVIVQIFRNGNWEYFFTGSTVVADKLERYEEQLPFEATICEEINKNNNKYYTFK